MNSRPAQARKPEDAWRKGPVTLVLKQRLASTPPLVWLLLLTLACLAPFANKAFHVDDTLFLRAAQHIQKHPSDFYGFSMNWFGTSMPMVQVFDNPPLTCYYIALVAAIAGWSEAALHLAFLLPALAAAWGTFALARNYCQRPIVAGLVAVLTPVFLISATTLMCDVMLLAFWVWSIVLFEKGLQKNHWLPYLGSGLLVGLAILTKFTGLALVPLLAAYGLTRQRGLGAWLTTPLIPILFAAGYEWVTFRLYGHGLLLAATSYASNAGQAAETSLLAKAILGLSFLGGCFVPALLYPILLWPRSTLVKGLCFVLPCAFLLPFLGRFDSWLRLGNGHFNWELFLQSAVFIAGGLHVFYSPGPIFGSGATPPPSSWCCGYWVSSFSRLR
jgi:4-amino-4-deoxy-L-arabinose transferase-like glycosyltransferase